MFFGRTQQQPNGIIYCEYRKTGDERLTKQLELVIENGVRSIQALESEFFLLGEVDELRADLEQAIARGYFRPAEDARLRAWFARFLSIRAGLMEAIEALSRAVGSLDNLRDPGRQRCFLAGYAAACMLARVNRFLVDDLATHKLVQRKLNEAAPEWRIPRRQYTRVRKSLTDPMNAWRMYEAMRFARAHREELTALASDPLLAPYAAGLDGLEANLQPGFRRYLKAHLRYRWHSWRRRRASATQQALFSVFAFSGRMISRIRYGRSKHLKPRLCRTLADLLRPGDVLVTRHNRALTNLFLPGFWPHVALYIGAAGDWPEGAIDIDEARRRRWQGPIRVLEARKDGVLLRPLEETLAVDAVAVIRPRLTTEEVARAIGAALVHEGKLYNFDFDFFRSDRLVCSEVVYRAYDGIGNLDLTLRPRSGRPTLSAEDLLDLALAGEGFQVVALAGVRRCRRRPLTGSAAARALAATYRNQPEPAV
jgi:hypothetical protein